MAPRSDDRALSPESDVGHVGVGMLKWGLAEGPFSVLKGDRDAIAKTIASA